jgi:hypothetical protein
MDKMNRKAAEFIENKESVSAEESFDLFCDLFNVSEYNAADYFNGRKFVPAEKKNVLEFDLD